MDVQFPLINLPLKIIVLQGARTNWSTFLMIELKKIRINFYQNEVFSKPSKEGKYISFTIPVDLHNEHEFLKVFNYLSTLEGVVKVI